MNNICFSNDSKSRGSQERFVSVNEVLDEKCDLQFIFQVDRRLIECIVIMITGESINN